MQKTLFQKWLIGGSGFVATVMAVVLLTEPASAQQALTLDQTCVVSVLNRTAQVRADGTFALPNVPANMGQVRARATCVRNGQTIAGQSDYFKVPANGVVLVNTIRLDQVDPIPTSLSLAAPTTTLTAVGQTVQVSATAKYPDGSTKNVTLAALGTNYFTSNSAIASVSPDGLVTAAGSGTALISANNEAVLGLLQVRVSLSGDSDGDGIPDDVETANGLNPNDPIDALEDADRDGVSNLDEYLQGTNIRVADSDGDGLSDGQEIARGTNPLLVDTDGDGIRDGLEVQTGSDPLDPNSYNLAQALASMTITPLSFLLQYNTIVGEASRQLTVTGNLIDGTSIDLTATSKGTNYTSSNITICSFGAQAGRVFAGAAGTCTITASNSGFSGTASGEVRTFSPTALSFVSIPAPGFAYNVDVSGNYAYVSVGSTGLQVVDVSDRRLPKVVASLDTPGTAFDVKVVGPTAFIADGASGLRIVDVANPTLPVTVGSVDTPGQALDLAVSGNLVFVADNNTGLQIVDVSNLSSPRVIGSVAIAGVTQGVDVSGTLAVVAVGASGIRVIDVADPTHPTVIGSLAWADNATDVVFDGTYAFVADYVTSFTVVDLTDPRNPVRRASTPQATGGLLTDVALAGQWAFGADGFFVNGVPIINVSNPVTPIPQIILNFSGFRDDDGQGIAVDSSFVYLTAAKGTDSRLYIGQYLALEDTEGIPPTVRIASPVSGDTIFERSTIPITVSATDDFQIVAVNFFVNGQVVFTDTTAPYQYSLSVPVGVTSLTLGASAIDIGGNTGLASDVRVNVIPDPGSTVTGRVVDISGNPVSGATVTTLGQSGVTDADGTFIITGVSTILGNIVVNASAAVNGQSLIGTSDSIAPVRGGITSVGNIEVTQCISPPSGLVNWWPGDGSAFNLIGANGGTNQGGATFEPGKVGKAFSFDGVDDYVSVPDSADQKPSSITVDFWLNLVRAPSVGSEFYPLSKYNGNFSGWIVRVDANRNIAFSLSRPPSTAVSVVSSAPLPLNTWVHIAATYDGTTANLYIDGVLRGSLAFSGGYTPAAVPTVLGRASWGNIGFTPGRVDEVDIFNRALSVSEIQAIFNTRSAGKCKPFALGLTGIPSGLGGLAVSPSGDFYVASYGNFSILGDGGVFKVTPDGQITQFSTVTDAFAVAVGPTGDLFVTDFGGSTQSKILKVTPTETVSVFVPGNKFLVSARGLTALAFDPSGFLYTASGNTSGDTDYVYRITQQGALTPIATGTDFYGVGVDSSGMVYSSNGGLGGTIYKIPPGGALTQLATGFTATAFWFAVTPDDSLYVLNNGAVFRVDRTTGTRVQIGTGSIGLASDSAGNLYTIKLSGGGQIVRVLPTP